MLYSVEISISPNTPRDDPVVTGLEVVSGVVKRVWVRWRWGSANLCGCRISRWGSQLWPRTLNQWFPSSILDTTFDESYPVDAEPLEFRIEAYNLDDTYPHTLWVALSLLREEVNTNIQEFASFIERGGAW